MYFTQANRWRGSGNLDDFISVEGCGVCTGVCDLGHAWLGVELPPGLMLSPSHYGFGYPDELLPTVLPRYWVLEARISSSSDGDDWICIKRHVGDESLSKSHRMASWPLHPSPPNQKNISYQAFRLRLSPEAYATVGGSHTLYARAFELYGTLRGPRSILDAVAARVVPGAPPVHTGGRTPGPHTTARGALARGFVSTDSIETDGTGGPASDSTPWLLEALRRHQQLQ